MTTRVTLIRHGQTLWNTIGRWQGHAPIPLNEVGQEQARTAAPHLQQAGITRIVSSDLLRARQTAEIIAEGLGLPVIFEPRWREIDLGDWQGLTMDEIKVWDAENHARFETQSYIERFFPGGESNRQHIARVIEALDDLPRRYPDGHVLVATHGGSIRSVIYHLTGEPIHLAGNCSLTRLELAADGQTWTILGVAEMPEAVVW